MMDWLPETIHEMHERAPVAFRAQIPVSLKQRTCELRQSRHAHFSLAAALYLCLSQVRMRSWRRRTPQASSPRFT